MNDMLTSPLPEFFKALSEPTRLRILRLLIDQPHCVCEMEEALGLPQPLLSRHLAFLRHAGLVEGRREGVRVQYRLRENDATLRTFLPALRRAFAAEEQSMPAPSNSDALLEASLGRFR